VQIQRVTALSCSHPDGTCPLPRRRSDGSLFGFEADHILQHASGGATVLDNGQLLCAICHAGKTSTEASHGVKAWVKKHRFSKKHGWVCVQYRRSED
jgi:5-methylcytosine-specific restriction endonuclease McrA